MFVSIIQVGLVVVLTVSSFSLWSSEEKLQQVMGEQEKNHQSGAESQKKVSNLADETLDLRSQYHVVLTSIEDTRIHNEQMRKVIQNQKDEITSVREQIVEAKKTNKEIIPHMERMLSALEQLIKADVPFLGKERLGRLQKIKNIMDRANVTVSEKYRKIIEAYQRENEYGNTMESYQGLQDIEGKEVHVDYLRVGRLVLIYQTLDGNKQAYWDHRQKQWIKLPSRYDKAVNEGLKMAKNQMAPTLLTLPVPVPQKATDYKDQYLQKTPAKPKPASQKTISEENTDVQ